MLRHAHQGQPIGIRLDPIELGRCRRAQQRQRRAARPDHRDRRVRRELPAGLREVGPQLRRFGAVRRQHHPGDARVRVLGEHLPGLGDEVVAVVVQQPDREIRFTRVRVGHATPCTTPRPVEWFSAARRELGPPQAPAATNTGGRGRPTPRPQHTNRQAHPASIPRRRRVRARRTRHRRTPPRCRSSRTQAWEFRGT